MALRSEWGYRPKRVLAWAFELDIVLWCTGSKTSRPTSCVYSGDADASVARNLALAW